MPQIVARSTPPAAPAGTATADLSSSSSVSRAGARKGGRAERGTAFDDVLSGARRREPAPANPPPPEAAKAEQAPPSERPEPAAKSTAAKPKERPRSADEPEQAAPADDAEAAVDAEHSPADAVDPHEGSDVPTGAGAPAEPRKAHAGEQGPLDVDVDGLTAEQILVSDPHAAGLPAIDSDVPTDSVESPGDAPDADGAEKPPRDPAVADPKDVLGDQPTPVLLAEIAQAQQAAHAAPQVDAVMVDAAGPAEGSPTSLPTAVSGATSGSQVATNTAAAAEQTAAHPQPDQPATDGDMPRPTADATVSQAAAASSNAAEDVRLLEPSTEPAATLAAVPTQAAPDASATAAAATRAMEALAGQPVREAAAPTPAATASPLPPEVQFAEDNHPNIVAGVRGQLMPSGGTMQIHLDPPELGPLAVTIRLNDGVMEASFETSNDQAAKMLSHSLSALKTSLEAQGVTVERLHVQQAPKSESANQQGGDGGRDQQQNQPRDPQQDHAARQEHQRREMLRRMWAKLRGTEDPLDMVA